MRSDDAAHGPLSFADRERLHATLAVLAESTQPARPFERITETVAAAHLDATGRTATTNRARRRIAVGAVACLLLVSTVATLVALRSDHHPGVSSNTPTSEPDNASSLLPVTTAGTVTTDGTVTSPTTPATPTTSMDATFPEGPWYSINVPGIGSSAATAIPEAPFPGARSAIWASADGSFSQLLVVHRYPTDPGFTTLQGTIEQHIQPLPGVLTLLADPDDVADPVVARLVGNEMRWLREDGSVLEYVAYGIEPVMLNKFVLIADDPFSDGCPCDLPELDILAVDTGSDGLDQQSFALDGAEFTLTRSAASPINAMGLGDLNAIATTASQVIDDHPGVIVDDDTAVWEREGHWFSLTDVPAARLDEVLDALRPIGSSPSALSGAARALTSGWNQLPSPPLSPRLFSSVAWTGSEAIVVGGSQAICPPAASCAAYTGPTFNDGAAYNPATNTWRTIAPAPLGFSSSPAAVVAGDVFILIGPLLEFGAITAPGHLLRYQPDIDMWDEIGNLPAGANYRLLGTDRLVLYRTDDAGSATDDWTYTAENDEWLALPDDALPESYNRRMVATDNGYIVFGAPVATSATGQQDVHAARYDFGSPGPTPIDTDSHTGDAVWIVDDQVVLDPHGTGTGGQLDTISGMWSDLPAPPADPDWHNDAAGAFNRHAADYEAFAFDPAGPTWVLDTQSTQWIKIEPIDNRSTQASTAIGRNLFTFGGQSWHGNDGAALDEAWIWTPPSS